ncbi:hypothetical protein A3D80_00925 [Candidatus Roizmanbacteria bacterium RIFCSPHIGHO2_02_FULL_40_13b]|uniref:Uncharacterized protein n=1 Tax=Candidatus Roizmanbacteria bacterium RIFCSPHIGHO2_01_FULL_39_24 TaxID=1802032 RepID=A0A1F7GIQ6_9BACT|nr:MAG: hypothetical protein A2799_02290 [Candidatus Roizmanbacteria bacterium RIFCSPHIGHO2_01_FULL_39_24]OGK26259.1 MAG: hypothetical protein A3D80_00925 [Candidatus Roizmanbacteria bacterium RIFCSPHIGHO2_02_FULL_40_13b]OGK48894.1 MAG: hypothetical protein A3A56_01685 [Candidatus Roizmanbacteria bacterium RIFCSPLOWO2_01_FULL_40_32]OGK57561.1 MAG: hypothetical protein A3H83_01920 [Candidatus Roizmanbacteria bacterium RIFCSPLOWO2_02_FULL_39_8]
MNYTPLPTVENSEAPSLMKKIIVVFFFILMAILGISFALAVNSNKTRPTTEPQPTSSRTLEPTSPREPETTSTPVPFPSVEPTIACADGWVRVCEGSLCQCIGRTSRACTSNGDCSGRPCQNGYCVELDYNMEQTKDSPCPAGTVKACQGAVCECISQ